MTQDTLTPDGMGVHADDASPDPFGRAPGGLQREEVDAVLRAAPQSPEVDPRGIAAATEVAARLVEALGDGVRQWIVFRDEVTLELEASVLERAALMLRDEEGFALLSDISPVDRLGAERRHPARFNVDYHVTRLAPGAPRLRLRVWVDDGEPLPSVMGVWPTADWHEREAWDFFGIEFTGREGLRRLIMPDDWSGHPLRKDYPLGGEPVIFTNTPREL